MYLSVQEELKSLRLQDKSKKIVGRSVKKACHTRWLSIGQAVACGLLTKMHKPKFIGYIYIFRQVLPILNRVSMTFQGGRINFSHIGPAVDHAKKKLQSISSNTTPVKQLN